MTERQQIEAIWAERRRAQERENAELARSLAHVREMIHYLVQMKRMAAREDGLTLKDIADLSRAIGGNR